MIEIKALKSEYITNLRRSYSEMEEERHKLADLLEPVRQKIEPWQALVIS